MSESPKPPFLEQLLSAEAVLLHETRRPYVAKRVVRCDGKGYVLYRIPRRDKRMRFEDALRQAAAERVRLQPLVHVSENWLVLGFASGAPLGRPRPGPGVYRSLGRMLASLHRVESDHAVSLLRDQTEPIPYRRVLDRGDLDCSERRWVAQSAERLYRITRFQLTHGDLHRQNILVNSDEHVSLIDYELFAFEPAGLELAMVLLRDYCRHPRNRQVFMESYLKSCRQDFVEIWKTLGVDLLFAAALRLAAQRALRKQILKRQRWVVSARRALGLLSRDESADLLAAKQKLREGASVRMLAYDEMALRILRLAAVNPQARADELLSLVHGN